ncbi:hypothetical protein [Streptomyces sp. NPDC050504]|uniref:hypothetical protein n=1 Tax=Streptomyces sp. NPDC050504 TaxID=3365618 RepID=UPI00379CA78A
MSSRFRAPVGALLLTACAAPLLAAVLSGCGGTSAGGLKSAGETPEAIGPSRLWPDLPRATTDPYELGDGNRETVPGVSVPGDDVHEVSAVSVVQAEVKAHPEEYTGADGLFESTARQIRECGDKPDACPVLQTYYRDLTGNGRDEMIVGIKMPQSQLAVRVYTAEAGRMIRIMSTSDAVINVELAGRDLLIRATSGIPGYEYRTAWSYDDRQRAMFPTHDEFLRIGPDKAPPPKPLTSPTPLPPTSSPAPAPPASAPSPGPTSGVLDPEPAPPAAPPVPELSAEAPTADWSDDASES